MVEEKFQTWLSTLAENDLKINTLYFTMVEENFKFDCLHWLKMILKLTLYCYDTVMISLLVQIVDYLHFSQPENSDLQTWKCKSWQKAEKMANLAKKLKKADRPFKSWKKLKKAEKLTHLTACN